MKLKSLLTAAAIALAGIGMASADPIVVNLTGATAFRAASHNTILQLLGGEGVTEYAYIGTSGLSGSNRAIFKGSIGEQEYIVRTSWSGSLDGIAAVVNATPIQFLTAANSTSTAGINLGQGANPAPAFENAVARWSFSDVDKLLSNFPNATLGGGPVGVVPFMFVLGEGAPGSMSTNMTTQIHNALWGQGQLSATIFGGPAETIVLATGRNNGSGTRATILSETGYGSFTPVIQFNAVINGDRLTGTLGAISEFGNEGHSSNSGVRDVLTRDRSTLTFGGEPVDAVFCSYLTISDALAATGYNPTTGESVGGEGAIAMTFNGARYSEDNVKNGAYTLWGYQQLYLADGATGDELTFDSALRTAIPGNMGTAGIPIPDMNVTRFGGDGGLVLPNE